MESYEGVSLRDIIDKYYFKDAELLKRALIAKIEEDKKQVAEEILKIEKARVYMKKLDIELLKEQSKLQHPSAMNQPFIPMTQFSQSVHSLGPDQHRNQHQHSFPQPNTPISPNYESPTVVKRSHSLIEDRSVYHNKVMKALRAKIKGKPHYDPYDKNIQIKVINNQRQRTLPKINTNGKKEHEYFFNKSPELTVILSPINTSSSSSPSL